MSAALEFQNVDILFARERGRTGDARIKAALAAPRYVCSPHVSGPKEKPH